ncbi:MAG: hypothetical protein ACFFB3_18500, partial [Candidatus Hodarchaeota archaeon]
AHRRGFSFKTITIKLRFADFTTHTKSITFSQPSTSSRKAVKTALKLLQSFYFISKKKEIRLVGSRLSGLQKRNKPLTEWF